MERAYFESVTDKTNSMLMQDDLKFSNSANKSAPSSGALPVIPAQNITRTAV